MLCSRNLVVPPLIEMRQPLSFGCGSKTCTKMASWQVEAKTKTCRTPSSLILSYTQLILFNRKQFNPKTLKFPSKYKTEAPPEAPRVSPTPRAGRLGARRLSASARSVEVFPARAWPTKQSFTERKGCWPWRLGGGLGSGEGAAFGRGRGSGGSHWPGCWTWKQKTGLPIWLWLKTP